jgi:L-serine dehydratase
LKAISILNDVLGPVMRGPSSSHTAASYQIGVLARALLGGEVQAATFTFDPAGSYAQVYAQQGSDRAFAAGLMGWSITDDRFYQALDLAAAAGFQILFEVKPLPHADHPNTVDARLVSEDGRSLNLVANSIGGGALVITRLEGWPLQLRGDTHEVLVEVEATHESTVRQILERDGQNLEPLAEQARDGLVLLHAQRPSALVAGHRAELEHLPGHCRVWTASPVFYAQRGQPLLSSAAEMATLAEEEGLSLGQVALAYESALLGLPEQAILDEMQRRFQVMEAAVERGLGEDLPPMMLLRPTARRVHASEAAGRLPTGGIHTRAAARAMAVMHVNGGHGVVCAAPTAGSAGVVPAVAVTMAQEWGLNPEQIGLVLLAASAVGLVLGTRATFAAEVAGCQVEICAAGAMGAAAVVEAAGGTATQALDAAAISFQNTMGSICDLVQGIVEIPCHTRNAAAASGAFLCADLILGGYTNPIPLDETIDAVYAVGQMLPRELRCTALGGLAVTPSALALPRLR